MNLSYYKFIMNLSFEIDKKNKNQPNIPIEWSWGLPGDNRHNQFRNDHK